MSNSIKDTKGAEVLVAITSPQYKCITIKKKKKNQSYYEMNQTFTQCF